jgi:hypothetical protein
LPAKGSADLLTPRLRVAHPGGSESTFSAPPAYAYWVNLVFIVLLVLKVGVLLMTVYAFVHAAIQRPDAYTATDKMTKPVWLAILGVATLLTALLPPETVMGTIVGACAAGVYLVDVRPKLLEIQGKSQ